jgi:hypothetical protein
VVLGVVTGHHEAALQIYSKAIDGIGMNPSISDDNERAILHSNRAACYLAISPPNPSMAITDCNTSISFDSSYAKAHFRKAQAHEQLSQQSGISDVDQDNHLNQSLLSLTSTLKLERNNIVVVKMAERVRIAQQKRCEAAVTPLAAIERLAAAAASSSSGSSGSGTMDEADEIKRVMAMFVMNDTNKRMINDAHFPSMLCDITLRPVPTTGINSSEFESWRKLRTVAIRALQTVGTSCLFCILVAIASCCN